MEERTLAYQPLNLMQMLDVVREAETAVLATGGDAPYATVMHVQLEMRGAQPVIHLSCAGEGRRLRSLQESGRAALLFRRDTCTGAETVLIEGAAEIIPVGDGARVMVPAESISGRRYFLA